MNSKFVLLLITLILSSVFLSAYASAKSGGNSSSGGSKSGGESSSGDSNDNGDNEYEDHMNRELEVKIEDHQIEVQSMMRTNTSRDYLKFKSEAEDEFRIFVMYAKQNQSESTSVFEFKFKVFGLVEYTNAVNGTSTGFEFGDDVVQSYKLKDQQWNKFVCTNTTVNAVAVFTCAITTQDGVFTADLIFTADVVTVDDINIRPTSVKFGFKIINFPYIQSDSRLALVTRLVSGTMQKTEHDRSNEQDEGFEMHSSKQVSFGDVGFFSWITSAIADNVNVTVISTGLADLSQDDEGEHEEGEAKMVFSFDAVNPTSVVWDPKIGVDVSYILGSSASIASASIVMIVIAVVSSFLFLF